MFLYYIYIYYIHLFIQFRPDILKNELKVFFVKYNDPIYVKLEKLEILIRLTNQGNIAQVLSELKELVSHVTHSHITILLNALDMQLK